MIKAFGSKHSAPHDRVTFNYQNSRIYRLWFLNLSASVSNCSILFYSRTLNIPANITPKPSKTTKPLQNTPNHHNGHRISPSHPNQISPNHFFLFILNLSASVSNCSILFYSRTLNIPANITPKPSKTTKPLQNTPSHHKRAQNISKSSKSNLSKPLFLILC